MLQAYPYPHAALTPSPSPVVSILFLLENKCQCHHVCTAAMEREDRAFLPDPLPGLTDARDALDGDLPHALLEARQAWVDFADLRLFPLNQLLDDLQGMGVGREQMSRAAGCSKEPHCDMGPHKLTVQGQRQPQPVSMPPRCPARLLSGTAQPHTSPLPSGSAGSTHLPSCPPLGLTSFCFLMMCESSV